MDVRRLIEPGRETTDIHGEAVRSAKYHLYDAGEHVPNSKMIGQAEQAVPGTALIIEHVLWEILRAPLELLGKAAPQMLRQLSPDIQELILAPNNQIRLSSAHHYLRALERRRSLDGLAALIHSKIIMAAVLLD